MTSIPKVARLVLNNTVFRERCDRVPVASHLFHRGYLSISTSKPNFLSNFACSRSLHAWK
jgi:hypothetical protein